MKPPKFTDMWVNYVWQHTKKTCCEETEPGKTGNEQRKLSTSDMFTGFKLEHCLQPKKKYRPVKEGMIFQAKACNSTSVIHTSQVEKNQHPQDHPQDHPHGGWEWVRSGAVNAALRRKKMRILPYFGRKI